jgi:hypothetical protein
MEQARSFPGGCAKFHKCVSKPTHCEVRTLMFLSLGRVSNVLV